MDKKRIGQQKGLTTIEYVIGAASLVLAVGFVFSGMAAALLSKFQSILSSV
ncbi:Flp family type IVb pilin [Vibrio crassostreae]|nr:Flp family type IVb pilin [Vibrio crassostreae]CAK3444696.1 Flp family type IVb pilin [Vibrio crassostreae]CAK3489565.1 Flp family type IVb pilin [Vibrio crassostreae]CAK3504266.1 Flp family type IVb pilin [Vibrio crassostreae]CAK3525299.1 Flp family type IVb pilin [Vibrio crassostreae]